MRFAGRTTVVGLIVALAVMALPAAAREDGSDPRATTPTRISGTGATGDDDFPAMAINPSTREALVVWTDARNGDREIWGRRMDTSTGTPLGGDFLVSPSSTEPWVWEQYKPSVAYSPDADLYMVVWTHQYSIDDLDVLAQRVTADGKLKGGVIYLSTWAAHDEYSPDVAYSTARRQFLVVWVDNRSALSEIFGWRVRPNGNPIGTAFGVATAATGATAGAYEPAVAYNTVKGQYQVVWTDNRFGASDSDIYGQRVRDNGNLIGVSFGITYDLNRQYRPDIAFDPYDAEYYVAWEDERRKSNDIYGQLLSSYGKLRGGQRRIALGVDTDVDPSVSVNTLASGDAQRYLVVWTDTASDADIYGRYVDDRGQPQGDSDFPVVSSTERYITPALPIANDPTSYGWPLVWSDERGTSDDIWGMVFP